MNPKEYESYLASIYEKDGYKTTVTPYAGDGGIDVIAEKEGKRIVQYNARIMVIQHDL